MIWRDNFNGHEASTHPRWAKDVKRYVYAALDLNSGCIKIGCTLNVDARMRAYGNCVKVMAFIPGNYGIEQWWQARLRAHRARGFRPHSKEWFNPTPEVLLTVSEMMFAQRAASMGILETA